jgi:hypothetical protein
MMLRPHTVILATSVLLAPALATGCASRADRAARVVDTAASPSRPCILPAPVVVHADPSPTMPGASLLQRYDVPGIASWEGTQDPVGPDWPAARRAMATLARSTDPVTLLLGYPTANNRLVARHAAEWIAAPTCLEKALLGAQHARLSFAAAPTEFIAFVLARPDSDRLRIWYYTVNRNGSGSMTPLTSAIQPDLDAGWTLRYSLHNHPFAADTARWHGIPGPSAGDAQFHQNYAPRHALPEARITNGFSTVRIPAKAFPLLTRSDDPVPAP